MAEGESPNGPETGGPQPPGTEEGSDEGLIQTFLIADIRGYSRFTQDHGDEAAGRLAARYAQVTTEVIEAKGGTVIELTGDEALCVFPTTRRAIRAAIDLQVRFLAETESDPALPLPVGIGIDTGEAVPVGAGFRGRALNLASRLCASARAGEILATREAVHMAGRMDGVHVEDRGVSSFKNIAEPVSVMRVTKKGEDPARWFAQHLPPPQSPSTSRASTKRIAIGAALAVVVAVGATIVLIPDDGDQTIAAGSVGFLDLSGSLDRSRTVGIGELPRGLATGAGSLWVTDQESGLLLQVNPSTSQVEQRIPVGVGPTGVAIAGGYVWVANTEERTVSVVDPQAHRVVQTIVVGNGPLGIVADGDRVWVANSVDATVTEIDATDGTVTRTYTVQERPVALAVGLGAVWVANASDGTVSRVVAGEGETQTIPVGRGPAAIAFEFGALWVANADDGTVTTVDPTTLSVTSTEPIGEDPVALAAAGDGMWVASARDGTIHRVDPATTSVTEIYEVGNQPTSLTGAEGGLWVGVEASPAAHRGGTLRLVMGKAMSIDPHDGELVGAAVLASAYDGLVTYRRAGGAAGSTVVPDLAVSLPRPTDAGRTYTFTLRDGIRFSNGHVLTPQDVVATIERVLVGPSHYGRFLLPELDGGSTCTPQDPEACDLSQGVVPDEAAGTVTFHLVRSAPDFLKILATLAFTLVPVGTPIELAGEPIPATGPYLIGDVGQDGSLVLERNPMFHEWSADAQPDGFADRVEVTVGVNPDEQVAMVEAGEADVGLDGVPADLIEELERRASEQMVRSPFLAVGGLALNTATSPFNNPDARRAVAYALDRDELNRAWANTAEILAEAFPGSVQAEEALVSCQILPPNSPGYAPYCPYTRSGAQVAGTWAGPDPSHAIQLVRRSGTAGEEVVIAMSPCLKTTAKLVAATLRDLGYVVVLETDGPLRPPSDPCWFGALSPDAEVSFVAWLADYPSAASFLVPLMSCVRPDGSPAVKGAGSFSFNFTNFCDPQIDRRMQRALDLQLTDPHASARAFEALDNDIVDLAPMIPYGTGTDVWLVSKRVSNIEISPQLKLIVSQVWVR